MHDILVNLDLKKDSPSLLRDHHNLREHTHAHQGQYLLNNLRLLVI